MVFCDLNKVYLSINSRWILVGISHEDLGPYEMAGKWKVEAEPP